MKRFGVLLALALAIASTAGAQALSKVAGVYDSTQYGHWGASVAIGETATGAQTITVCPGILTLPDGRAFQPFAAANGVFAPITIDVGSSVAETVTPTASSLTSTVPAGYPATQPCAQVTATFTNAHGASASPIQVISGDNGLQEAINDASLNGGGQVYWQADGGNVTLSTSGATTTLCSSCIPARAVILGVVARVNTTITACSGGWELGDGTTAARFAAANGTLTAGTLSAVSPPYLTSGIASTSTGAVSAASALSLINTCVTSNASAGAIHAHLWGYVLVPPAS